MCKKTIEALTGVKRIAVITDKDWSFYLKAGQILAFAVIKTTASATVNIGTTDGGAEINTDVINGTVTYSLDWHSPTGQRIYFTGFDPISTTIKLLIFNI